MTTGSAVAERAPTSLGSALRPHVVALALVLLALTPFLGTDRLFSADEAAVAAQAHLLAEDGTWLVDHPVPELADDPTTFPLQNSDVRGEKAAPFGKHPAYPILLAAPYAVAGVWGMKLLSVVGTLVAAYVGALLARRMRPGVEVAVLWTIGLASPLFLYGYVLIAHTLGAACAGLVVLGMLWVADGRGRAGSLLVVGAGVGLVLLRTEGLLFAMAAAGAALAVGVLGRRVRVVGAGLLAGLAGVAGYVADRSLQVAVVGVDASVATPTAGGGGNGYLADRISGAEISLVLPGYHELGIEDLALVLSIALLSAAFVIGVRRPADAPMARHLAIAAVPLAALRLLGPATIIPGLFVAFPALSVGLVCLALARTADRDPGTGPTGRTTAILCGATAALFGLAVVATQYATGGTGEWGGRYFALVHPILVPLVVVAVTDVARRMDGSTRRALVGALVAVSLIVTVHAGRSLWFHQHEGQRLVDTLAADRARYPDAVVVARSGLPGRFSWREVLDGGDFLLFVELDDLEANAARLAALDRPLLVLASAAGDTIEVLDDEFVEVELRAEDPDLGGRTLVVMAPR